MRGSLFTAGEAMCFWGAELDTIVVGLASQAILRVVWEVPWKPRTAILVNLGFSKEEWECWRPPAFEKMQAADPEREWVQTRPNTLTGHQIDAGDEHSCRGWNYKATWGR